MVQVAEQHGPVKQVAGSNPNVILSSWFLEVPSSVGTYDIG